MQQHRLPTPIAYEQHVLCHSGVPSFVLEQEHAPGAAGVRGAGKTRPVTQPPLCIQWVHSTTHTLEETLTWTPRCGSLLPCWPWSP